MTPKILRKILNLKAKDIKICQRLVGHNHPVYFIAEAGVNHNGNIKLALRIIEEAKKAGADAIKFQTFKAEQVCLLTLPMARYQKNNTDQNSQYQLLKSLELKEKDYPLLQKRAKKIGIDFLSTPHGHLQSARFLKKVGIHAFKIASSDITDFPLLEYIAKQKLPAILSTGESTLKEIHKAIAIFDKHQCPAIILHCVSNYPVLLKEANMAAILDLYKNFSSKLVGYSDHTIQEEALIAATALGACIIETHFTLDKNLPGPDQKVSFEPKELKIVINKIRKTEKLIGAGFKKPTKSELRERIFDRRSITTFMSIAKGGIFSDKNLITRRPEKGGLKPQYWNQIIGKKATRDIPAETQLKKGDWQ